MSTKRRTRSPHPGVKLNKRTLPSGQLQWRARFLDPETDRQTDITLDSTELASHERRRLWGIRKSKELAKRRMELEMGGQKVDAVQIQQAIDDYIESASMRLREGTVDTYRPSITRFLAWALKNGLEHTGQLHASRLASLRDALIAAPLQCSKPGGKRGQRIKGKGRRKPNTVNIDLRALKTMLNAFRRLGRLPGVTKDQIGESLQALPVPREEPDHLDPLRMEKLLHAALRHDAAVFDATRDEHAGLRLRGSTRRYQPIAPFVAFLLLTGCRRGEALGLTWGDLNIDALDHEGRVVGEIRLRAEHTKTHQARTIGLEVSPALRKLLARMKLQTVNNADWDSVFGGDKPYTANLIESSRGRLVDEFGAPAFTWQGLRSTCATYLTCATGIWGSATVFLSARQLGHSVTVAEKHYLGTVRGVSREARTLEAAMGIEAELKRVIDGEAAGTLEVGCG